MLDSFPLEPGDPPAMTLLGPRVGGLARSSSLRHTRHPEQISKKQPLNDIDRQTMSHKRQ